MGAKDIHRRRARPSRWQHELFDAHQGSVGMRDDFFGAAACASTPGQRTAAPGTNWFRQSRGRRGWQITGWRPAEKGCVRCDVPVPGRIAMPGRSRFGSVRRPRVGGSKILIGAFAKTATPSARWLSPTQRASIPIARTVIRSARFLLGGAGGAVTDHPHGVRAATARVSGRYVPASPALVGNSYWPRAVSGVLDSDGAARDCESTYRSLSISQRHPIGRLSRGAARPCDARANRRWYFHSKQCSSTLSAAVC